MFVLEPQHHQKSKKKNFLIQHRNYEKILKLLSLSMKVMYWHMFNSCRCLFTYFLKSSVKPNGDPFSFHMLISRFEWL